MNISETKTKQISKTNLQTTLRVLHNLYMDERISKVELIKILKLDYGYKLTELSSNHIEITSIDEKTKINLKK